MKLDPIKDTRIIQFKKLLTNMNCFDEFKNNLELAMTSRHVHATSGTPHSIGEFFQRIRNNRPFSEIVIQAFSWGATKERSSYWRGIHKTILEFERGGELK